MFYDSKGMKRNAHQKQMAKLRRERREKEHATSRRALRRVLEQPFSL